MGDDEDLVAGLYSPPVQSSSSGLARERSTNINEDPKFRELKHYQKSHGHEKRLRAAAELEERVLRPTNADNGRRHDALRLDGCDVLNEKLKTLALEKANLPQIGSRADFPECFYSTPASPSEQPDHQALVRRMSRFQTRLQWRDQMDSSLRRLMQDMDFARDDRLREYSHQARCDHLDRIYDWYIKHGMKEARKERAGPPFIRFSTSGPVMPGSMRVASSTHEFAPNLSQPLSNQRRDGHGIHHSSSSPTLLAAGSLGVESAATSPRVASSQKGLQHSLGRH